MQIDTEIMSEQQFKQAAVIGSPIVQSKSPQIHQKAYELLGLSGWNYTKVEVTPETLPDFIAEVTRKGSNWAGFSVTMPLKQELFKYIATENIDKTALETKAINTVINKSGTLYGYNTDVYGIEKTLSSATNTALILGSGATARSAFVALKNLGARDIYLASRQAPEWFAAAMSRDNTDCLPQADYPHQPTANPKQSEPQIKTHWFSLVDLSARMPEFLNCTIISTLPLEPAKIYVPQIYQAGYKGKMLECAYPATDDRSIKGEVMLTYQAIKQVELMTGQTPPFERLYEML